MIRLFENKEPMRDEQILDLLIRLIEYGEFDLTEMEIEEDGTDIIIITPWGKVKFSWVEEHGHDYEGEGMWQHSSDFMVGDSYKLTVVYSAHGDPDEMPDNSIPLYAESLEKIK